LFKFLASLFLLLIALPAFSEVPAINKDRAVYIGGPISNGNILPLGVKLLEYVAKDKTKPVTIILNSPGGDVLTGFLFINYMERVKAQGVKINCYVQHMAASMAFQILLHCDKRYALANSLLLWHPARIYLLAEALTAERAKVLADELTVINQRIFRELVMGLAGLNPEEILRHFGLETLHFAADLQALTDGKFITVERSIPGLLEADGKTMPTNEVRLFDTFQEGRIYYIYQESK
jgi:ATP-dependent protease ClpP protease subunit